MRRETSGPGRWCAGHPHARVVPVVHRRLSPAPCAAPHCPISRGPGTRARHVYRTRVGRWCAMSKCSPRRSQASRHPAAVPGVQRLVGDDDVRRRTGSPEVIVHACRSCTPTTPSTPRMCDRTSARSTRAARPPGARRAPRAGGARPGADEAADQQGGDRVGGVQPVAAMTRAATTTAPSRGASARTRGRLAHVERRRPALVQHGEALGSRPARCPR